MNKNALSALFVVFVAIAAFVLGLGFRPQAKLEQAKQMEPEYADYGTYGDYTYDDYYDAYGYDSYGYGQVSLYDYLMPRPPSKVTVAPYYLQHPPQPYTDCAAD
jgi:hypothetical protein